MSAGQSTKNWKSLKETEENKEEKYSMFMDQKTILLRQQYFPNWSTDLTKPLSKSKVNSL